jgi:long-chain acyl-CoA synthetase
VLYRHPSVREIGVIGVPDRRGGELVQAHVVLKEGSAPVTQQQMLDFARMHLAEYKVPDQIIFSENLPYGPTGKIDRKTLREKAIQQIERESYDSRDLPDHH